MTLSQLSDTLPNGLHDAELFGCNVSFIAGTVVLDIAIDVSTMEADGYFEDAEIRLTELLTIVLDAPCIGVPMGSSLLVLDCETDAGCYPAFSAVPQDIRHKFYSLYLGHPCNTFMHIAAESAEIEWKKGSRRKGSRRV